MKKKWTQEIQGISGLDYITFINVPMVHSEYGDIIDLVPNTLEILAAKAIIKERIPLRGMEVQFLRKTLGLSRERFAAKLDLSSGAIVKWEQNNEERLHLVNEVAVRAFLAEQLGVDLPGKFSELKAHKVHPINITAA